MVVLEANYYIRLYPYNSELEIKFTEHFFRVILPFAFEPQFQFDVEQIPVEVGG